MRFEDFDHEDAFGCNCQLLQTVQHLVNKYRDVIAGRRVSGSPSSSTEHRQSPSTTACGGPVSPAAAKTTRSLEYAPSEASAGCDATASKATDWHGVRSTDGGGPGRQRGSGPPSPLPPIEETRRPVVGSPVRIVRVPSLRCPVHSAGDRRALVSGGPGLDSSYDAIAVSHCWRRLGDAKSPPRTSPSTPRYLSSPSFASSKFAPPTMYYVGGVIVAMMSALFVLTKTLD